MYSDYNKFLRNIWLLSLHKSQKKNSTDLVYRQKKRNDLSDYTSLG